MYLTLIEYLKLGIFSGLYNVMGNLGSQIEANPKILGPSNEISLVNHQTRTGASPNLARAKKTISSLYLFSLRLNPGTYQAYTKIGISREADFPLLILSLIANLSLITGCNPSKQTRMN